MSFLLDGKKIRNKNKSNLSKKDNSFLGMLRQKIKIGSIIKNIYLTKKDQVVKIK